MKGGEFDMVIHFTEGDDRYYYCFKDEGFTLPIIVSFRQIIKIWECSKNYTPFCIT